MPLNYLTEFQVYPPSQRCTLAPDEKSRIRAAIDIVVEHDIIGRAEHLLIRFGFASYDDQPPDVQLALRRLTTVIEECGREPQDLRAVSKYRWKRCPDIESKLNASQGQGLVGHAEPPADETAQSDGSSSRSS